MDGSMTDLVPHGGELEQWTAPMVVGAVVDSCNGMTLPPQWKSLIGKNAKAMLDEGIPPPTVIAACFIAVRRGKPQLAQYIAGDLMLAQNGMSMSERDYQIKLATYEQAENASPLLEQQERRRQERLQRRARGGDGDQ